MTFSKFPAFAAIACFSLLSSCVSYWRMPEGYSGATATIKDSSVPVNSVKAETYRAFKLNGKLSPTRPIKTPYGGGMGVSLGESANTVPAGQPLTLNLVASDSYAADGVALADMMSGNARKPASGDLSFTPKSGGSYVVKGQLGKDASTVWLEDEKTGKQVGQKFSSKP